MAKGITVAEYITEQIRLCGKTQKEIAALIGYDKPQMISMIKQGTLKLPVSKVGPLAKALEVNPAYLLRLVLSEYMPETWTAIEELMGSQLISGNEYEIIKILRDCVNFIDMPIQNEVQRAEVVRFGRAMSNHYQRLMRNAQVLATG